MYRARSAPDAIGPGSLEQVILPRRTCPFRRGRTAKCFPDANDRVSKASRGASVQLNSSARLLSGASRRFNFAARSGGSLWPSHPDIPAAPSSGWPRQIVICSRGRRTAAPTRPASSHPSRQPTPLRVKGRTVVPACSFWCLIFCSAPCWPPSGRNYT